MIRHFAPLLRTLAVGAATFLPALLHAQWTPLNAPTATSLRGVAAPSEDVVWVSGARGTVARSTDGGATWSLVPVPGADSLDFRDVEAVDANTAWVLSIGNGAQSRIYRTVDGGANWSLQFANGDSAAFYDCMAFWSPQRGVAMSDPVQGRYRVLITADGGATWRPVPESALPPALAGEASFAASGTCITTGPAGHAWIVSGGGERSRVFHSPDWGASWHVRDITPIAAGAASRGAFSIATADGRAMVVVGGDYTKPAEGGANVALSSVSGASWAAPTGRVPAGYRSGVAIVPGTGGHTLVAVGTSGSDVSHDGGNSWAMVDSTDLNAVTFASARVGYAVGPRGRVVRWSGPALAHPVPVRKEP